MFKINIKPMSTNKAWQGRRFKSEAYKDYVDDLSMLLLPLKKHKVTSEKKDLIVTYNYYLSNYALTDVGNLEKQLTDILVQSGFIPDDRYIKKLIQEKHRSKEDYIEVDIKLYDEK